MTVTWVSPDGAPAYANFVCACCQHRINKGETIYMAKQQSKTIKLCEECAETVEIEREVTQDMREDWLGEENW